jgi:hypothetical protein
VKGKNLFIPKNPNYMYNVDEQEKKEKEGKEKAIHHSESAKHCFWSP